MPDFLTMVATLREQMQAELTRTDALRPMIWPIAGLLTALVAASAANAPHWLLIALAVGLGATLAAYVLSYVYFVIKDPASLRSERYNLHKMAIEHGLVGDSQIGLHKLEDLPASSKIVDALPSPDAAHD